MGKKEFIFWVATGIIQVVMGTLVKNWPLVIAEACIVGFALRLRWPALPEPTMQRSPELEDK